MNQPAAEVTAEKAGGIADVQFSRYDAGVVGVFSLPECGSNDRSSNRGCSAYRLDSRREDSRVFFQRLRAAGALESEAIIFDFRSDAQPSLALMPNFFGSNYAHSRMANGRGR